MSEAVAAALEEARRGLLDLTPRNRLLALPARARGVVVLDDEAAGPLLAGLAAGRGYTFESSAAAADAPSHKAVGIADPDATRADWQDDAKLRVRLPPEALARRLREIQSDARSAREESGIATLSLAIGALHWRDPATPDTLRTAPLALVPAQLARNGVSPRFRLRAEPDQVAENLSLRELLATRFQLTLPPFDPDAYDPASWSAAVAAAVAAQPGWILAVDHLALGLFSFAKFLMWRDLDPAAHPGLVAHPMICTLVGGEALSPDPSALPDETDIDDAIPVERLDHVLDADGSQARAIEAVRRGGHLVIQGPPGTGKSQTIANIIAQAVLDGRSVLFVAQKQAALEVVQRRLVQVGLGAACLDLHSDEQSPRAVLDALRTTLDTPGPARPEREAVVKRLGALRGRLNRHAAAMRDPVGDSGLPLHAVVGRLAALRARGVVAGNLRLDAGGWDAAAIEAARTALRALVLRAAGAASPFAGVGRDLTPGETDRLLAQLPTLIRAFAGGAAALAPLAAALGLRDPGPDEAPSLRALAERLAAVPAHDPTTLAHPAWMQDPAPLAALVAAQATVSAAAQDARLLPGALEVAGLAEARAVLAEPGGVLGFLSSARRAAQAVAARVARDPDAPLPALDLALAAQRARATLAAQEGLGRAAFGTLWGSAGMAPLLAWREAAGEDGWRALATGVAAPDPAPIAVATAAWQVFREASGFEGAAPGFARLVETLSACAADPESLALWQGWRRARAAAPALDRFAAAIAEGSLPPDAAEDAFEHALLEALLAAAMRRHPELAGFEAAAADQLVADFRAAAADRVELMRAEAAAAHAEDVRRLRTGTPGMDVLRGEMERKRGHLPVRELLLRARQAVQAAKPVLLMSPLSVAQFLAPPHGLTPGLTFDLLVMDEASQIEPVDALGAIARARQIVVVGDDRQLPPTRFFQRLTGEDAAPREDEVVAAADIESVLGLCNARGVPSAMLRWHYRSRHESLIAFSNAQFYGGRLCVLPSPRARSPALGLSLVRLDVPGREAAAIEAEAVAAAVIRHARETPGETLGVVAFSERQRDMIEDAVEAARRASPETESFFTAHRGEPFFIKNLESVQGDERDAIFISVGFVRAAGERLRLQFGPVSAEGGERRLNVLVTRAKARCVVFSDIGAEDIDLSRSDGRGGEAALKAFLAFAAGGAAARAALAAPPAAPLAALIGEAVARAGRQPVAGVGLSGLFLDVAAKEGEDYVLGIETDAGEAGVELSAQDRERGRAAALTAMGWRLTRAWSLAWLERPAAEAARIAALLGADAGSAPASVDAAPDPGLAQPYRQAVVELPADLPLPALPFGRLAELVAAIVTVEAPVHADVVAARLLGGRQADAAEAAAIRQGLQLGLKLHGLVEEGGFWRAQDSVVVPRDRRAAPALLRRAAMVAPSEIEAAARVLLAAVPLAGEAALVAGVVRLLGLEPEATNAIAARVAALAGGGRITVPA